MWSDNETSEDLLGFEVHADLLIDIIKDESVLPITIGVFGDWGSGKSSILQIVKNEFDRDEETDSLCIYFNGWTFEGYDDAKAALLNSIVKELEENKKISEEVKDSIKEQARKLWKSIDWMRGAGMVLKNVALPAVSAYFTGGASLIPTLVQKITEWGDSPDKIIEKLQTPEGHQLLNSLIKQDSDEKDNSMNAVAEFRNDFANLIAATKFKRLVIIIDDLDRCSPERIIENLEAIKLFLNVPKTAFVIGADPRIVKYAIENKYRNNREAGDDNSRIVIDYLEKIIQLPYSLPRLSESEVETYISMLICKKEVEESVFEDVLKAFNVHKSKNKYSAFGLSNFEKILTDSDYQKVKRNIITIPALVPLITNSLYGNPRQIKRFLNTYTIRQKLAKVAALSDFNDAILAKMMILEYSEPNLFKKVYEWQMQQQGVPKEISIIEDLCKDKSLSASYECVQNSEYKDWAKHRVLKWLQVEPLLSGTDLRDYFWIARDKLESSLTAASLIPPIVRTLYKDVCHPNMSKSVLKDKLQEGFSNFNEDEKVAFLSLLSSNLKRNPREKLLYDIFHTLIDEKIDNVIFNYIEALKVINEEDIPVAIGARLSKYKLDPELGPFLANYFKINTSKTFKAFNLNNKYGNI